VPRVGRERVERDEFNNEKPVIPLTESSAVIRALLLCVYPLAARQATDPSDIYAVYEAAHKYLAAQEERRLENILLCQDL
jgi:hypothetical protein